MRFKLTVEYFDMNNRLCTFDLPDVVLSDIQLAISDAIISVTEGGMGVFSQIYVQLK